MAFELLSVTVEQIIISTTYKHVSQIGNTRVRTAAGPLSGCDPVIQPPVDFSLNALLPENTLR